MICMSSGSPEAISPKARPKGPSDIRIPLQLPFDQNKNAAMMQ
jgi:hypothetical protein